MELAIEAPRRHWTAEEVRALPDDGKRYEVVDGELLVTLAPMPRHQRVVGELYFQLQQYLRTHPVGEVLASPADIELALDTLVQPDLFVFLPATEPLRTWKELPPLLLAIEVLSPSTARSDRVLKRGRYQRAGFPEYWIVDPESRTVERWRPAHERPEIVDGALVWHPDPEHPPLTLDLPTLFARALRSP